MTKNYVFIELIIFSFCLDTKRNLPAAGRQKIKSEKTPNARI